MTEKPTAYLQYCHCKCRFKKWELLFSLLFSIHFISTSSSIHSSVCKFIFTTNYIRWFSNRSWSLLGFHSQPYIQDLIFLLQHHLFDVGFWIHLHRHLRLMQTSRRRPCPCLRCRSWWSRRRVNRTPVGWVHTQEEIQMWKSQNGWDRELLKVSAFKKLRNRWAIWSLILSVRRLSAPI